MTQVNFVQALLKRIKKTQTEFGRDWGYHRQRVNNWTTGRTSPKLEDVAKWVEAYKLPQKFVTQYLIPCVKEEPTVIELTSDLQVKQAVESPDNDDETPNIAQSPRSLFDLL